MGCGQSLFLGDGGYVTCSYVECPDPAAATRLLKGVGFLALNTGEVEAVHFHYTKNGVSKTQYAARQLAEKMLRFLKREGVSSVANTDVTPDWRPGKGIGTPVEADPESSVQVGDVDGDAMQRAMIVGSIIERCGNCNHARWAHGQGDKCAAVGCPCESFVGTGEEAEFATGKTQEEVRVELERQIELMDGALGRRDADLRRVSGERDELRVKLASSLFHVDDERRQEAEAWLSAAQNLEREADEDGTASKRSRRLLHHAAELRLKALMIALGLEVPGA